MNENATDSERIWRCSCGAAHFLSIRNDSNWGDPIFIIEGTFRGSLRRRIRQAFRHVLGHGHGDSWLELCLDDDMIREIRDQLNALLPKTAQITYATTNTSTTAVATTYGTKP